MRTARRSLEISRSVQSLWRSPKATDDFSSAVSLHGHTLHSREGLEFIPRVLRRVPLAHAALQRIEARHQRNSGRPIPFSRAFWRPPLHPHAAHDLEARQIEALGLRPFVSLTDHDTLEACAELHAIGIAVPFSTEWTIRYHRTIFHVGVHNLPPERARPYEAAMAALTAAPESSGIRELLAALHAEPDVLIVLNHPFSCEELVDRATHIQLLTKFLSEFGAWFHALELNGLQPATNNLATIRLASERDYPLISGGDRHCTEPNANLNLTNAASFTEFVHEVRDDRRSTVLFLPQYRDAIPARYIEFIWQAVRPYPDFAGRQRWADRVFYQDDSGAILTFAQLWPNGCPTVIHSFVSVIALLASPGIRAMLCLAYGKAQQLEPERL